jgi:hypothetical protein
MKKLNLMVHSGGVMATRDDLARTFTPAPTPGNPLSKRYRAVAHQPIPHDLLLNNVTRVLENTGYTIINEAHALGKRDKEIPDLFNHYFGMLQISHKDDLGNLEQAKVVGLRNAHDKTFAAGAVFGGGIFICDNLAFSGQAKFGRNHTARILVDLERFVEMVITTMRKVFHHQDNRVEVYKAQEINTNTAYSLIIDMMKQGAILPTMIPEVVEQWDTPKYEEFAQASNVWRLFNAVTTVNKDRTSVFMLPQRTAKLYSVLDDVTGMDLRDPIDVEAMIVD